MDRSALFMEDLRRLHRQAKDRLRAVIGAAPGPAREPAVTRFFDAIHTYKGTSGMVKGFEEVSRLLHSLEGALAARPVPELSRKADWLVDAQRALVQAGKLLEARTSIAPPPAPRVQDPAPREPREEVGLLVIRGNGEPLWIPLSSVHALVAREDFAGKRSILAAGRWVPVLAGARDEMAVVARTGSGTVAIGIREAVGVRPRAEAADEKAAS